MVKLLDNGENILTQVKSTNAITAGSVIELAKKQADELSTTIGKTVLPIPYTYFFDECWQYGQQTFPRVGIGRHMDNSQK